MKLKRKTLLRTILVVFLFWFLAVGITYQLNRSTHQSYSLANQLINKLESTRTQLIFHTRSLSYSSARLEEEIEDIRSLLSALKMTQDESFISLDFEYFIYSIGAYTDDLERLSKINIDLQTFVEQLHIKRKKYNQNPGLQGYFDMVGATVLDSLYANHEESDLNYRKFDHLYQLGTLLDTEEATDLNQSLASANDVIASYVRAETLLDQLLANDTFKENERVGNYFHTMSLFYNYAYATLSFILLIWLVIIARKQSRSEDSIQLNEPEKLVEDSTADAIDISYMSNLLNDDAAVEQLLNVFIHDHQNDAIKFKGALERSNEDAIIVAHSLKGVAASIGAKLLKENAMQMEAMLKRGIKPTDTQIEVLELRLRNAIIFARNYVTKSPHST
ncbi:Hpt domain-containing protein [Vibrio sp. WJH972]